MSRPTTPAAEVVPLIRTVARLLGEVSLLWLLAASTTASFAPRGVALNAQDQLAIHQTTIGGGLELALPAAALCFGLWWLLTRELLGPLAVGAAGLLAVSLLLPHDLTLYFLPTPLALLLTAFLLNRFPDPEAPRRRG